MNSIIKIILHLFYWLVFCLFAGAVSYRLAYGFDFIAENIPQFLYNLVWAIVQFYAFYFFFYKFIVKQRYIFYFILSVVVSISLSLILTFLFFIVFNVDEKYALMDFVPQMAGTFIIAQTGSLLRGFIHWLEDIQLKQEVEKLALQNELDALNAQLNPHFLFNTLNNIDTLIRSNPDKASESLITLSEIMRYMLYDARNTKVLLQNEVKHYLNIVKLQALRLKDPNLVKIDIKIADNTLEVAPLLFLPFIENAFKHARFDGEGIAIEINFLTTGKKVDFTCRNHFQSNDPTMQNKAGGIGLKNITRRLELLYQGKYNFRILYEDSFFVVHLSLET